MTETGGEARKWWIWHQSNKKEGNGSSYIRRETEVRVRSELGGSVGEVNPSSKCAEGAKSGIIQDTNVLNRRHEILPRGEPEEPNAENSA